jgi:drug/metabolite transporter (DMT)-like permease
MLARHNAAFTALLAAALFGATTPVAKTLLGSLSPLIVAGLFYLGSGVGLAIGILVQRLRSTTAERQNESRIQVSELPWLLGAIAAGGVAGPALLMLGLSTTPAATSSLLLNLEGVFTAVIAWVVFRENVDLQIFLGMVAIVVGGVAQTVSRTGFTERRHKANNRSTRPMAPHARTTGITPTLNRNNAMPAASPISSDGHSKPPCMPCGHRT